MPRFFPNVGKSKGCRVHEDLAWRSSLPWAEGPLLTSEWVARGAGGDCPQESKHQLWGYKIQVGKESFQKSLRNFRIFQMLYINNKMYFFRKTDFLVLGILSTQKCIKLCKQHTDV